MWFREDANPYPQLRLWRLWALLTTAGCLFLMGVSGLLQRRWNQDLRRLIVETCRG